MDNAIASGRLFPAYTVGELAKMLGAAEAAGLDEKAAKVALALRQRDKTSPDYIPTLAERLAAVKGAA